MTTPSPVVRQFGRTLAFAEHALSATLRDHLAQRQVTPETWYALQLIATDGPALARESLTAILERSRTLDPDLVRELLARLKADGLICGDAKLDLTPEGQEVFGDLREYIADATIRLVGQFDSGDIETTVRTLQAITQRAEEERAVTS